MTSGTGQNEPGSGKLEAISALTAMAMERQESTGAEEGRWSWAVETASTGDTGDAQHALRLMTTPQDRGRLLCHGLQ